MKVKDSMQRYPVTIGQDKPIRDALRIFINRQVHAILVVKSKKLVGVIAQEDILQNLFPSLRDFMEGIPALDKGSILEENLNNLLDKPVSKFMKREIYTVRPSTSVMKAQSVMLVNKFSHLPVCDHDDNLLGIISQGDIFKALVSKDIPFDADDEYHDWLSHHWDLVNRKRNRYSIEVASIEKILNDHDIKTIIDVGSGTGGHDLNLAEKGYLVTGIERSVRMYEKSLAKYERASKSTQKNLSFTYGKHYHEIINKMKRPFQGVIYMGNALSHCPDTFKKDLKIIYNKLPKKGLVLMQVANAEKVLDSRGGFQDFNISESKKSPDKRYAFLEFYERSEDTNDFAMLNMVVLHHNGNRWVTTAMNTTKIAVFSKESLISLLHSIGFTTLSVYGSRHNETLFSRPFNPVDDDWINVVAVK